MSTTTPTPRHQSDPDHITVEARADGTGTMDLDGITSTVTADNMDQARRQLLHLVAGHARSTGHAVTVLARDPHEEHLLRVAPDGQVEPIEAPREPEPGHEHDRPAGTVPATAAASAPPAEDEVAALNRNAGLSAAPHLESEVLPIPRAPATKRDVTPAVPAAAPAPAPAESIEQRPAPTTRAEARSFLTVHEDTRPPENGWRAFLARLGIKTEPSATEKAYRGDVRAVSSHWPGPRTIAVVNGKGGAGKTPTTALLSALFARHGGSGVLAWDNNETRGTLGWRTEQGTHESHVLTILPFTERLMEPNARAADLAAYVHHQTVDKYDVLRSNPLMLPHQQRLTAEDFDAVHAVASKYYRLVFVDSGNDETAPHWLRMIDHADQLVVATTTRPDHAEAGRLLLDALRDRDPHSRL
ncbi:MAG: ATPase, partial [Actinomycetota bacterium]|nr:ATPase [Actinomycetota bacterium]